MTAQRFRAHLRPFALASFCTLITLGCPAPENGIVYVNVNTPATKATQDGTSWSRAFATIQDGIDTAANAGLGEVWVAQGVYNEVRSADSDGSLVMRHGVNLYGGFLGFETSRALRNWDRNATVIDGANGKGDHANAEHVIKGADAILDGFSVTGGKAVEHPSGSNYPTGGGMYNDSVTLTVANCDFYGNVSLGYGGAMYNLYSNVTVSNCVFRGNRASFTGGAIESSDTLIVTGSQFTDNAGGSAGGAIHMGGLEILVSNCRFERNISLSGGAIYANGVFRISECHFEDNVAREEGGAICVFVMRPFDGPVITDCAFKHNFSNYDGGAICVFAGGVLDISSCVFSNNTAGNAGGAILAYLALPKFSPRPPVDDPSPEAARTLQLQEETAWVDPRIFTLSNCLLFGNSADRGGALVADGVPVLDVMNCTLYGNTSLPWEGGAICTYSTTTTVSNSILWANYANGVLDDLSGPASISYSCTQSGLSAGSNGNISADPEFVDPLRGDFLIKEDSPCIDSGTSIDAPVVDIRGQSRPRGAGIDMGAFEK